MKAKALTLAVLLASTGVSFAGTSDIEHTGHHSGANNTAEVDSNIGDAALSRTTDKSVAVDKSNASTQNKVLRDNELYNEYAPYNDPMFY